MQSFSPLVLLPPPLGNIKQQHKEFLSNWSEVMLKQQLPKTQPYFFKGFWKKDSEFEWKMSLNPLSCFENLSLMIWFTSKITVLFWKQPEDNLNWKNGRLKKPEFCCTVFVCAFSLSIESIYLRAGWRRVCPFGTGTTLEQQHQAPGSTQISTTIKGGSWGAKLTAEL